MYKLTLTKEERKAIDWVGGRYWHGVDFRNLLIRCAIWADYEDGYWDDDKPITFEIPEHIAWEIKENLLGDSLTCFDNSLVEKLHTFLDQIV